MTKHFSTFEEDTTARPHEISIHSEVAPAQLPKIFTKSIEVEHCGPEGCEIHAPLGKKHGFSTTRLLFLTEGRDTGYPHEARYAVCDAVRGKKGEFECVTERGGKLTRHEGLAIDGDELVSNCNGVSRHFHRVKGADLTPS